jgi:hypothetical protein
MQQYTDGAEPTSIVQSFNGVLSFTDGELKFLFPSTTELKDRTWKANVWDRAAILTQSAYNPDATMDLNKTLFFPSGSTWKTPFTAGDPNTLTGDIISLTASQYTGADLASALQTAVRTVLGGVNVTWNEGRGRITFTCPGQSTLRFPTAEELRDKTWVASNWAPYSSQSFDTSSPRDFNGNLHFPGPSDFRSVTETLTVDLLPFREVFLHSSLTNFRTLKGGSGEKDCLCRIPVESAFGDINVFRNFGGQENSISASDQHFRSISFSFRAWDGTQIPMIHPVSIELCFLDSDPYAL